MVERRHPITGAVHLSASGSMADRRRDSIVGRRRSSAPIAGRRRIRRAVGSEAGTPLVEEDLVVGVGWTVVRVCPGGSRAIRAPLDREDDAYSFG